MTSMKYGHNDYSDNLVVAILNLQMRRVIRKKWVFSAYDVPTDKVLFIYEKY